MTEPQLVSATFDHVGIASASRQLALAGLLGEPSPALTEMPSGVAVGRFGPGRRLELVTAVRPGNPIERFLATRGPGLHHLALAVGDPLEGLLAELAAARIEVVGAIQPAADGRPSIFLHPSSTGGILIELVEGTRG
jgi:methylmalonyl-CoA/ethylmalonyl-CoA epimerase